MQELKQLIISRIHDIKQLQDITQDAQQNSRKVHQLILKQRNGQQFRNRKEMEILSIANLQNFQGFDEDVENIVYEICGGYDEVVMGIGTERRDRVGDNKRSAKWEGKDRLLKALKGFFHRNGYREKIGYLNSIFDRNYGKMSVGLIFTLLSEWSKKKYLTVLSSKIKDIKSRYNNQLSYSPSTHKLSQIQSMSHKSAHLNSLTQKKSFSLLTSDINHTQTNSHTDILQKLNKLSVGTVNSNKILTIYNRSTLYGYFVDQLEEYYNLTGIEELDKNYVKLVPKRKMKQNLAFVENMNRATEVLIEASTNKEQRMIIKEYLYKYKLYKEEMRKIKIKKMEEKSNSKNKSVRTMSDHIPGNAGKNSPEKKLSVDLQIVRDNGGESYGFSIELQTNMSSSLLNLSKQNEQYENLKQSIMKKIKNSEGNNQNVYNFDKSSNRNKIKFPTLSRSMDKKQKTKDEYVEKTKLYRFPTNEDQNLAERQQETKSSLFKFSQRQTIKGIIIKNFLSNREKQKMSKIKQSEMQQLYIKNKQQENSKRNGSKLQIQQRKAIESVDLRSLRQKTKALLKNFRTIQNY